MRITELFTAQSIALDVAAPDQAAILDKLVDLQATHGNITDKDAYKKALYAREAEASTYVDNGITVPHARTACVTRPSLAALRLSTPVQYNADDDGKTDLLFAIAAPENGSLHIDMLARMMQMLMNDDFVEKLRAAKTPAEFLDAIDAQEDAQFGEESFTQQEIPRNGYRVLAVTACPNGIAHTYMAAEALTKMGDKLGLPTKVETNGSDGAKNVLTPEEIAACDGIIIAADKNVETARFDGKPVLFARVDDGIHKPEELIKKIAHGETPIYHAEAGAKTRQAAGGANDSFGHSLYKHLMNGVSHMLPFVVGGGIMIALAFLLVLDLGTANIHQAAATGTAAVHGHEEQHHAADHKGVQDDLKPGHVGLNGDHIVLHGRIRVGCIILVDIILEVELQEIRRIWQLVGNDRCPAVLGGVSIGAIAVNFCKQAVGCFAGRAGFRQRMFTFFHAHLDNAGVQVQVKVGDLIGFKVPHGFGQHHGALAGGKQAGIAGDHHECCHHQDSGNDNAAETRFVLQKINSLSKSAKTAGDWLFCQDRILFGIYFRF